jgi:serine/threonine protein kinase
VINDKGYHGASADIWSCGVILFVLMAGYLPFDESNLMTLFKKIHRAEFTCPSWFSPGARKLILKILDPNPKTRITAAKIYKNEWFKKGYTPSKLSEKEDVNLDDIDAVFNESKVRSRFSTFLTKQQEMFLAMAVSSSVTLSVSSAGLEVVGMSTCIDMQFLLACHRNVRVEFGTSRKGNNLLFCTVQLHPVALIECQGEALTLDFVLLRAGTHGDRTERDKASDTQCI